MTPAEGARHPTSPRRPVARRQPNPGGAAERLVVLAELLALETDPVVVALVVGAQLGRHHRHPAARADRRPVFVLHRLGIPIARFAAVYAGCVRTPAKV